MKKHFQKKKHLLRLHIIITAATQLSIACHNTLDLISIKVKFLVPEQTYPARVHRRDSCARERRAPWMGRTCNASVYTAVTPTLSLLAGKLFGHESQMIMTGHLAR